MSVTTSYKVCPKCKTMNINVDVCSACGEILSYKKKQEIKQRKMIADQVEQLRYEKENPNFVERLKTHRFFVYRVLGYGLYSVTLVVSAIGAALAWATAMVMGG